MGQREMYFPTLHEVGSSFNVTLLASEVIPLITDSFTSLAKALSNCCAESITLTAFSDAVLFMVLGSVMLKLRNLKATLQEILPLLCEIIWQSSTERS